MATTILLSPPSAAAERTVQQILLPGQTPEGQHILGVLVKRTYDIVPGRRCARAGIDRRLVPGDVHYADPLNSTIKFESDFVPFKLATDVVLHGKAYAPTSQWVASLTVSLAVGQYRKDLLVLGDRVARYNGKRDPSFTDPQPFDAMELRYDRAYGGVDVYSDPKMPLAYPRNHLGRGYAVANTQRSVENLPLPNIEDPNDRLTPARLCVGNFMEWERQPVPHSFGWTMKLWLPRAGYAGVMPADRALEQELRKTYAALVPPAQRKLYQENQGSVMDFRFFNGASQGLIVPFLSGAELVSLRNLDPQGNLDFELPGGRPVIRLDIGQGAHEPAVALHTVMIRLEERQVDLVWRAAVPYAGPDWLPEMKRVELSIT
jgi:hypothetical protein